MSASKSSNRYPYTEDDINHYITTKGNCYEHFIADRSEKIEEFQQMNQHQFNDEPDEKRILLDARDFDHGGQQRQPQSVYHHQQYQHQSLDPYHDQPQREPQRIYGTPHSYSVAARAQNHEESKSESPTPFPYSNPNSGRCQSQTPISISNVAQFDDQSRIGTRTPIPYVPYSNSAPTFRLIRADYRDGPRPIGKLKNQSRYTGSMDLKFMYNHSRNTKRYIIRNGFDFNVKVDGIYHRFRVHVGNGRNQIQPICYEPGSINNGIKVNQHCIIEIASGEYCMAEIKVCASRHNDKLCIFNLTRLQWEVHGIFTRPNYNKDVINSLELINSTSNWSNYYVGGLYYKLPKLGMYIKRYFKK